MTVNLHGNDVADLYAAAVGASDRCTHIIVATHTTSGLVDYTWHARPHRDAQVFAAAQRTRLGAAYRIQVRRVRNRHWLFGGAA